MGSILHIDAMQNSAKICISIPAGLRAIAGLALLSSISLLARGQAGQSASIAPLPDIRQLMQQVQAHQRQLDKVRESYSFTSLHTIQDIDANGQVKKTQTDEHENFFVNGHVIARLVKRDGKPLSDHDEQKETEHVTKMVEKAEQTPPGQSFEVTVNRLLDVMDLRNERREMFRGRPAIVFDFVGRKNAKTHGLAEGASKKLQGTVWIDEADQQVACLQASFADNFHVAGGLFADIQKGSNFRFDQELVNGELWLPTGNEATMQARVLLLKNLRRHLVEKDYDYKRFKVETQQGKDAPVTANPRGRQNTTIQDR